MKKILLVTGFMMFFSTVVVMAKVAGTVNGITITVEEADKALKVLTKGQKKWSTLPREGKMQLLQMMAPSKLVAAKANKGLTKKEKETALSAFWMQKNMATTQVSTKETKVAYEKMKSLAKKSKSKQKIPSFEQMKMNIKMQLAQEKVVSKLMKKAKIKVK